MLFCFYILIVKFLWGMINLKLNKNFLDCASSIVTTTGNNNNYHLSYSLIHTR